MKVLLVGDIHLSDKPPSMRTEDYADEVMAKLEFTVEVAATHDVDAVVWAGDVFHIKTPSRTSHALVQRVARLGQSYPCPWLIVPGNHDMSHDRLESLDSQPLGVLFEAGAIRLDGAHDLHGFDLTLFGIPYLKDFGRDLLPYMNKWRAVEPHMASLMVTHAPIVKPGVLQPFAVIDASDWAEQMGRGGAIYFGHHHWLDGSFNVGDTWFCNQGALSRGSLAESDLSREPAVTIWDSEAEEETDPFLRVEVPHKPVDEVFKVAEVAEIKAEQAKLDDFLEAIESTTFAELSVEGVLADITATKNLSPRTLTMVQECIEYAMTET